MKRIFFLSIISLIIVACGREGAKVQRQLILHYDRPAAFFEEALPIGNGRLGAMIYGDPQNYELGLFGDFSVRMDESVKAIERMDTLLGDTLVGGNIVVKNGFVVVMLPAAEQQQPATSD